MGDVRRGRCDAMRWWQFGLVGGVVLSIATAIKLVRAVVHGAVGDIEWSEAAGFAAVIFGMGFLCGVIVWAGKGLYRRIGWVGDAIVGMVVMVVFFLSCMLLFEPELLGAKFFVGGLPMLGLAVPLGFIGGAWTGRDIRKKASPAPEHAVLVHFLYGSTNLSRLFALEERLEEVIAAAGVGEYDGNEVARDGGDGTLYLYGPDADVLFATVRPTLEATDFMRGARVSLRYGPPRDGVREVELVLGT